MTTIKRIQYGRYGGPELLRLEEFDPPAPGKGELRIRVRAAAANPMDWKIRSGDTKLLTGRRFPRGLGHDFAGIVEAIGAGVTRFEVGDAVLGAMSMKASGAFADVVIADETLTVAKPTELTFEQAAALPTVGVTALQAITKDGTLRAGQSIFIHGCLGGVGRAATQIAQARDVSVAGSCRSTARGEAQTLGIAPIMEFDFDPTPLKHSYDVVFDTAGTMPLSTARALLKPGGRIIDINGSAAKMARSVLPGPFQVLIAKYNSADLTEVARAAARCELQLPIARSVPLTQAITALTELECHQTPKGGKLVITTE
jgi:NADPH:quinone reductase-like Zn-dependent oxidoreductase